MVLAACTASQSLTQYAWTASNCLCEACVDVRRCNLSVVTAATPHLAGETCEVVIMDRGFDPVAPVIHDWTYEPLVYDLLAPQGSVFKYHAQTQGGE